MTTIKMQMTKKAAARRIAELIRDYHIGLSTSYTIGLMLDGTVDFFRDCCERGADMAVAIYDTAEWTCGDIGGDIDDAANWTDEALDAVADCFETTWIDEAVDEDNDYEIEWLTKKRKLVCTNRFHPATRTIIVDPNGQKLSAHQVRSISCQGDCCCGGWVPPEPYRLERCMDNNGRESVYIERD